MLEESKSKRVCILWNVKTLCMRYLFIVLSLLGNYYYCLWSLKNFWPLHIFHEFTDVLILPVYRERNIKSSTVEKHRRWPRTRGNVFLTQIDLYPGYESFVHDRSNIFTGILKDFALWKCSNIRKSRENTVINSCVVLITLLQQLPAFCLSCSSIRSLF